LCATPTATDRELEERDGLRLALLRHPDLQAVELDWSTRVIVATMVGPTWTERPTPVTVSPLATDIGSGVNEFRDRRGAPAVG
jgi:hypothetical protein